MPEMKYLEKTVAVRINPQFTFKDWELYDMIGSSHAASRLNMELRHTVNSDYGRQLVRDHMYKVMEELSRFGAYDTAVCEVLEAILDEIYGE